MSERFGRSTVSSTLREPRAEDSKAPGAEHKQQRREAEEGMELKLTRYTAGVVQTNIYFLKNAETGECVIVDPGANAEKIIDIAEKQLMAKPVAVLLTHGHFDHIMAAREVAEHFGVKIHALEAERELLADSQMNLSLNFGLEICITKFVPLQDGQRLQLLDTEWQVIATPGHTGGSCCYYIENTGAEPMLFSGDTLFQESYGRTDFPTGSERQLLSSIQEKLLLLPENTRVYPGHEGETTIENEKKYNPAAYLGRLG